MYKNFLLACLAFVFYNCNSNLNDQLQIELSKEGPYFIVQYKNDTITKEWSYDSESDFINEVTSIKDYGKLYFLTIHEGDGCPEMKKILHLLQNGKYHLTEAFGNCGGEMSYEIDDNKLQIDFSKNGESDYRSKKKYTYDLIENQLLLP